MQMEDLKRRLEEKLGFGVQFEQTGTEWNYFWETPALPRRLRAMYRRPDR